MPGASEHDNATPPAPAADGDAVAQLAEVLAAASELPASEVSRRVREALPHALAELAESNRRLREAGHRREELVAQAAAELRDAAASVESADGSMGERLEVGERLRRTAAELERTLGPPPEPRAPSAPRRAGVATRPRLLVVDDEEDAREALVEMLEPDYEVLTAHDGQAAIETARAEQPDLVLMDMTMPRLDGLQALERLRSEPGTADIPVIFVSGRSDDASKVRSLDLGAADYLQKPCSDRELRARVERTLRLARSQSALRELAQTDPLTGLANLRAFRARVDEEVKRARRYRTPLTCVMADMDNLKPVNDQLGHAAGDRAIAAVAAVIRSQLRETDFGARYGGDEFVLLLPHTSAEEGRVLAERVCSRLRESTLDIAGRRVSVGASFGVACLPDDPSDDAPEALVRAADAALYAAKHAGRGRVAVAPLPRVGAAARGGAALGAPHHLEP